MTAVPRGPATTTALVPSVFAPLLSHLPLAENVLALDVDHTPQGLPPAVPDLWHKLRGLCLAVPRVGGC